MHRAAVSIPSNIAEGAERDSKQEYIRFLHIAKGSAAELRTQLYIAGEVGLLEKETIKELIPELKHIFYMINSKHEIQNSKQNARKREIRSTKFEIRKKLMH